MLNKSCKDIILYYKGDLAYDTIGELIVTLKDKMKNHYARFGIYKRLLTLMIESLENIVRYSTNNLTSPEIIKKYNPELMICYEEKTYTIETANIVQNSDIPALKERIDMLRKMDPEQIKELYKATITNGKFSDRGGAGLGMIEMAKIADDKIKGAFDAIDENFSYFMLRLAIRQSSTDNS